MRSLVSAGSREARKILSNLSAAVRRGDRIALVGHDRPDLDCCAGLAAMQEVVHGLGARDVETFFTGQVDARAADLVTTLPRWRSTPLEALEGSMAEWERRGVRTHIVNVDWNGPQESNVVGALCESDTAFARGLPTPLTGVDHHTNLSFHLDRAGRVQWIDDLRCSVSLMSLQIALELFRGDWNQLQKGSWPVIRALMLGGTETDLGVAPDDRFHDRGHLFQRMSEVEGYLYLALETAADPDALAQLALSNPNQTRAWTQAKRTLHSVQVGRSRTGYTASLGEVPDPNDGDRDLPAIVAGDLVRPDRAQAVGIEVHSPVVAFTAIALNWTLRFSIRVPDNIGGSIGQRLHAGNLMKRVVGDRNGGGDQRKAGGRLDLSDSPWSIPEGIRKTFRQFEQVCAVI